MRTRGFDVLAWAHRYLPSPSDPSQPLVLSDEQAEFVLDLYAVDSDGVYLYRRSALEEAKGWGKSPLGAVLCLTEFAGPVAAPIPWVQIAACSEDQAVSNVYSLIWQLLSENEGQAGRELGIDLGKTRLYLPDNPAAKLEAVTSKWGAREGQRLTFGLLDETQHWLASNGGHKLARVLRRNAAKMDGRTLEMANAPELGEDSIAELTEREANEPGIMFRAHRPSVEPEATMTDEELLPLIREVYAGAPWVDTGRILREIRDPGLPWEEAQRFFFNLPAGGTLAAVDPALWGRQERRREIKPGEEIALGFDGSLSQDATALVACTRDGWIVPVEIIERLPNADEAWRVDRSRIHRALAFMFKEFEVRALYADPWRWQDELLEWEEKYGGYHKDKVLAFPTNSPARMASAVDRFRTGLAEGRWTHDGDKDLTRHVLNARLRKAGRRDDGRGLYMLEKAGPGRYIDGAVAAVLAVEAAAVIEDAPKSFIHVI